MYNFSGTIRLKENKIGFKKSLSFTSSIDKIETIIREVEHEDLAVEMKIESVSLEKARRIAELELMRVSNLLSWFENVGIEKYWITGYSFPNDKGGRTVAKTLTLMASINARKTLSEESGKKLEDKLKADYDNEMEDILLMWRDALRQESAGMKFFLLYRILEKIIDPSNTSKSTKKTDDWLKINYAIFPLEGARSIFTFLRDNVHAKSKDFPFEKIDQYINNFQDIVRKAIENKFPNELTNK